MRGRRPKKDTLAALEGGYKQGDFQQVLEPIPDAPSELSDAAKAEWQRVAPALHKAGLFKAEIYTTLVIYCNLCSDLIDTRSQIAKDGLILEGKRHPLISREDGLLKHIKGYAVELGLTPNSSGRIVLPPKQTAEGDELEQLLQKQR